MTKERILDIREVILPFVKKRLLETNYEGKGESDAKEFAKDFNEILALAIKGLEQEPTTKNDLGVDCISRQAVLNKILKFSVTEGRSVSVKNLRTEINELPSVTPQEPRSYKWCTDCREYDHDKHCCHRWSNVIRDTVEEIKQEPKTGEWIKQNDDYFDWYECSDCGYGSDGEMLYSSEYDVRTNYCPNCGCRMVEPQESEDKE